MRHERAHLSDELLMLYAGGELSGAKESQTREHLAACEQCRGRLQAFEDTMAGFSRAYEESRNPLPSQEGPRALFRARLHEQAARPALYRLPQWLGAARVTRVLAYTAAAAALLAVIWRMPNPREHDAVPRADLTPGAVRAVAVSDVCRARLGDNAQVIPAVQRQVFAEYGMPKAEARAYEVDYLITPALGGSDDIRNLWPQPYSGSPWNAYVKDALEDRLWTMVCTGRLDLATAQHEIATNWVAAYKKYFHTRQPLPAHRQFRREDDAE